MKLLIFWKGVQDFLRGGRVVDREIIIVEFLIREDERRVERHGALPLPDRILHIALRFVHISEVVMRYRVRGVEHDRVFVGVLCIIEISRFGIGDTEVVPDTYALRRVPERLRIEGDRVAPIHVSSDRLNAEEQNADPAERYEGVLQSAEIPRNDRDERRKKEEESDDRNVHIMFVDKPRDRYGDAGGGEDRNKEPRGTEGDPFIFFPKKC